jgi:hypothetical protein
MTTLLIQMPDAGNARPLIAADAAEFIAACPGCGTLETVWFTENGALVPTRKFRQYGAKVYHDCGAGTPCRVCRNG